MGSGQGGPIILRVSALLTTIRKFRLQKTLIYALDEPYGKPWRKTTRPSPISRANRPKP